MIQMYSFEFIPIIMYMRAGQVGSFEYRDDAQLYWVIGKLVGA